MHERARALAKAGWKHVAIVAAYAMGLWLFRQIIIPHYVLLTGVRVAALALVPYRYWPALIVGEEFALVPMTITCWNQLGALWALLNLLPATALMAPVVYAARERGPLIGKRGQVHVIVLLVCALAVGAVCTIYNLLMVSSAILPANAPKLHYDQLAGEWLLGNFLGMLTVVPTVLAVYQSIRQRGWRCLLITISESRATVESVFFIVPVLVLLIWAGVAEPKLRGLAQMAMFVPVMWLALPHGWQGAALGGTAASLALIWLMPERYDHTTIQAEAILASAVCPALLLGARIEALGRRAEKEREDVRAALALAQRNIQFGEMQLGMTAQAMEQARQTVRAGYIMMLERLRHLQPAVDDRGYQRLALTAQEQLIGISESLRPAVYHERGLPAALREGAVARMLDHAGIRYWCELKGPLSALSPTVHLALYRMVCEAIAEGCRNRDISDVRVRIRGGDVNGRRWVVVNIAFRGNLVRLPHVKWDDLLPRLMRMTTGGGMRAIKDRAAIFEGYGRERDVPDGRSISWLMLDI